MYNPVDVEHALTVFSAQAERLCASLCGQKMWPFTIHNITVREGGV
jgi:hypothetical protein